ncbi:MAG TPA: hypothetical protein VF549_05460 [Solirubrobacteraceae bacterium]|jgi:hypothetical protein
MRRRWPLIVLALWSVLIAAFYVWTVASNCSESGQAQGDDCGAAVGLGLLMAIMIWLAGALVVALVAGAVALVRRLAR